MIRTSRSFTSHAAQSKGEQSASAPSAAPPARSRVKTCNYAAPAGLFIRESSRLRYRGFESAALALQYANEELSSQRLQSSTMEVGDVRYMGEDVRQLYLAAGYPLPRPTEDA